jgi:hypothetical protein
MSITYVTHIKKPRESDKFKGFSYRKIRVDSDKIIFRKCLPNKIIAWEVSFNNDYVARFKNLKQAQDFIRMKANT